MRLPAPPVKFLFQHPAHLIACGFGSGLSPWAPGTVGTLFAWASYAWLRSQLPDDLGFGLFLLLLGILGVSACQIAGRNLGVTDHSAIVWDEIVPFWFVLLLTPAGFAWQVTAFALFRLYDITKPQPARFFDQRIKNGLGVMLDDVIAASYTVFSLALAKMLLDALGWQIT
jgi:phosphatidylglycerophosphatase A